MKDMSEQEFRLRMSAKRAALATEIEHAKAMCRPKARTLGRLTISTKTGRLMSDIKPIETRYKNCRFRSRLEARWAVFLDTLAIQWEYEKEGYVLGNLGAYLPDFWVPYDAHAADTSGWGFWLEIKPTEPTEIEQAKLAALTKLTGHRSFCLCGSPSLLDHSAWVWQHHHLGEPSSIPLVTRGRLQEFTSGVCREIRVGYGTESFPFVQHKFWPGCLNEAFTNATSARFEHGETPNG